MTLPAGTRIGPYEILGLLGAGGMGEVYRARDARLGRDVALKVLPAEYTRDAERLLRFEREARVLASLSHPNIATLYGLEHGDGIQALVMELVDGETLADRLTRGPTPVGECLAIARQIADGLDAAHQKGVIHRDLKPANIKIGSDGTVKILDFGIAKALQRPEIDSATTIMQTQEGVTVGTAPYMSPEQLRGQPLDRRVDIWAFGCLLYEMLTARSPFHGETRTDTIARIVGTEPEWQALPASTPAGLRRLITRCLEKDAKRRLRDVGDLDLALETPVEATRPPSSKRLALAAAGILVIAAAGAVAMWPSRERAAPPAPVRFEVPASIRVNESQAFALSPDGRRLAFTGTGPDGILRIWSRTLDDLETRPLIGTENEVATNSTMWFSPDGRSIAFYAAGTIKRVESTGGVPQVICKVPSVAVGGSWSAGGTIVVGNVGGGLLQCPATGGDPSPVTAKVSDDPTEIHLLPVFLPDHQRLIYLRVWRSNPARAGLYLADLRRAPDGQSDERVLATNFGAELVMAPDGSGRLGFVRDGALMAAPFDIKRGVVAGEPYEIAKGIGSFHDGANFRMSPATLAYRTITQESQLTWVDRSGRRQAALGEPGQYGGLALSPDGTRVAVVRENRLNRADADIWIIDVQRGTTTRFTTDPFPESVPVWSADGAAVIYVTGHDGASIWQQPISGAARSALVSQLPAMPFRINTILTSLHATPDGRFVLFEAENRGGTRDDVWRAPMSGNATPSIVLGQPFNEGLAAISPDGRWIAYVSNESGVDEVFVARWNASTATASTATLVSRGGATAPRWRRDSQELFYQSAAGRIIAVPIAGDRIGEPVSLFDALGTSHWAVAEDGQRFLFALPVSQGAPTPFTIVLNWQSAVK